MDDIYYYLVQYGSTSHRYCTCERAVRVFDRALRLARIKAIPLPSPRRILLKKCLMTKNCGDKYKIQTTVLMERNNKEIEENGIR